MIGQPRQQPGSFVLRTELPLQTTETRRLWTVSRTLAAVMFRFLYICRLESHVPRLQLNVNTRRAVFSSSFSLFFAAVGLTPTRFNYGQGAQRSRPAISSPIVLDSLRCPKICVSNLSRLPRLSILRRIISTVHLDG